jgi:U3 small nucleolar RNA-associated protein 18
VVTVFEGSATGAGTGAGTQPMRPVKSIMNLTTPVSSIAFHPSGELMAVASEDKKDHLRLVHLPSASVFTSWPTERTPLGRVSCLDFSAGGGFFAIGNKKGRVLLYKLSHFTNA